MPVRRSVAAIARMSPTIELSSYLIGTFVVGVVMAKLVEQPVLRLCDAWFQTRSVSHPEVTDPGASTMYAREASVI